MDRYTAILSEMRVVVHGSKPGILLLRKTGSWQTDYVDTIVDREDAQYPVRQAFRRFVSWTPSCRASPSHSNEALVT